jgi:hypothetical protein
VKSTLKHAGQVTVGMLPAAILARLGMPALAALVFLAVLVLGVACWIISNPERSDRVNRMMLARRGNATCLTQGPPPASPPSSRRRSSHRRRSTG